jgi:hypothetical protein
MRREGVPISTVVQRVRQQYRNILHEAQTRRDGKRETYATTSRRFKPQLVQLCSLHQSVILRTIHSPETREESAARRMVHSATVLLISEPFREKSVDLVQVSGIYRVVEDGRRVSADKDHYCRDAAQEAFFNVKGVEARVFVDVDDMHMCLLWLAVEPLIHARCDSPARCAPVGMKLDEKETRILLQVGRKRVDVHSYCRHSFCTAETRRRSLENRNKKEEEEEKKEKKRKKKKRKEKKRKETNYLVFDLNVIQDTLYYTCLSALI